MPEAEFHPYDPRALRLQAVLLALLGAVFAAWSLAQGRGSGELSAYARAGLGLGMAAAFAVVWSRLRPREGWGVTLEERGVAIARPLSKVPLEVEWDRIAEVRRQGRRKEQLLLLLRPEGRVLLQRHLFASTARFEQLEQAVARRVPVRAFDA